MKKIEKGLKLIMQIKNDLRYDYVLGYKRKDHIDKLSHQDKLHVRAFAILQLARDGQIEYILNHDFTEAFEFDKESQICYYKIKIIKRKEGNTKYADC